MKPTELRIGNYVKAKSPERKKWEEPYHIGIWDLECLKWHKGEIDIEPIPLTEDWLKKFGFIEWSKGNWRLIKPMPGFPKEFNYYLPYKNLSIYVSNINIEYVHQLQNLYFALTGKELLKTETQ